MPMGNDMFRSARFLTAADGMGFSYNENRAKKGIDTTVWLKHHWEANFIISGKGEVTDLTRGDKWPLETGVLYVVGPNDRHQLAVTEDMLYVSVFCPPLKGDERFDKDGGYEASGPIEKTDRRMFVKRADEMRRNGAELIAIDGQARTIRMLTKTDEVGFGLVDVHIEAGAEAVLWHKDRWQANHIVSGTGEITDLATSQIWKLGPSMAYNAGPEDRHRLRARTDIHLLSLCCPPLGGNEPHDQDGVLGPSGSVSPDPPGY